MNAEPTLGMRIRRARRLRRWTQKDLAREVGVSVRTVNDWERDRAQPRWIENVEEVLGIQLTPETPDPAIAAAENLRRMLTAHDPDIMLPDEWIERLVAEYLRLRRAGSEAAS